jgi:hypothetical protein
VTEDDNLQIGLSHRTLARPEQAEETAQEKVEEGPDHGGALSQMTFVTAFMRAAIEFLDPTGVAICVPVTLVAPSARSAPAW